MQSMPTVATLHQALYGSRRKMTPAARVYSADQIEEITVTSDAVFVRTTKSVFRLNFSPADQSTLVQKLTSLDLSFTFG